ncbi:6-phosphogluconolactonase [Candidatus Daviesbacteria bacterium]|nr:6-phosphogluconolactonase [Candidatus Daviesbacteria bacterium]
MTKNDVKITRCKDKNEASQKALDLLITSVDSNTLLLLSGGASPDLLYQLIVQDNTLRPGAVALIDERFGVPMHDNSNEKMIAGTGLLAYINNEGIPFYGILKNSDMEIAARAYEQITKDLFRKFSKKIAIMGIGSDGHTAGIKPDLEYNHARWVVAYDDTAGSFGKRVTLTFEALSEIDEFTILVFGENKKEAFEKMFEESDEKKVPMAFYTNHPTKSTILTTLEA